jgi:hypothetical protein
MMEDSVNIIAFAFLFLAFGTLGLIFRDAFRHLNSDDQITFRRWIGRKLSLKTRAVNNVWTTHVRDFPRSRKRLLFVLFLISFVTLTVGYQLWRITAHHDREQWFYSNLSEADKAGAINRGWVPDDIMPASSKNIRIVGELSPSKEWCAFEFSLGDAEILRKSLKTVDVLPPSVARVPTPGVSWWPEVLRGNLDPERINKAGLQLYEIERPANSVNMGIYLFALDWPRGRGFFFWTYKS